MTENLSRVINKMKTSKVSNYVNGGLNSYLLENGKVRLFKQERETFGWMTPHSHRFDFACYIVKGSVENTIWRNTPYGAEEYRHAEEFLVTTLVYCGEIGKHTKANSCVLRFKPEVTRYTQGEIYHMTHDQIHSIKFSKGSEVIFFEGPQIVDKSVIIEPCLADFGVVETYKVEPHMFMKSK